MKPEAPKSFSRREFIKATGTTLAVPGLLLSGVGAHAAVRELTARSGSIDLTNGKTGQTEIWGYDGQVPGPVLRARQGETLSIRLVNELEQPTSIHWHGIRIENAMDGSPLVQKPVPPGATFDYEFTLPDAGTYWYHTHTRGIEQLTRGLYGVLIVDEADLDASIFDDDIVLAVDDWLLDDEGQIDTRTIGSMMAMSHGGRTGNWATVNGVNKPDIAVRRGARVRARVVNTSNARIFDLVLGELSAWVIALDGQPVVPAALDGSLAIAPGQRVDLAVDIPAESASAHVLGVDIGERLYEAAYFKPTDEPALTPRDADPVALPPNPLAALNLALDDAIKVRLDMQGGAMGRMREATLDGETLDMRSLVRKGKVWAFNGKVDGDTQDPMFDVKRGATVSLDVTNDTAWAHAMHFHGHHFKHTHTDGTLRESPGPWRDTHLMERGERHTLSFVADNPGDWLLHCHMVEHAASGMTGWFRVQA